MRHTSIIGLAGIAAMSVGMAACSPAPSTSEREGMKLGQLVTAIEQGDPCSTLFPMLKSMDEGEPTYATAQDELRKVGCYMASSTRTDTPSTAEATPEAEENATAPASTPWPGVPGEKVTPSDACLEAARAAAEEPDADRADLLIGASLEACPSLNEWMSALEAYPDALSGLPPDIISVETVCYVYPASGPCQEATELGLVP